MTRVMAPGLGLVQDEPPFRLAGGEAKDPPPPPGVPMHRPSSESPPAASSRGQRSAPGSAAPAAGPVPWKAVALPAEHGGWGLLAEPLVLGLVLAPTAAGTCLAFGALFAFLARQPLRLALIDRRKGARYPRTALAERVFAGFLGAAALVLGLAFATARAPFWPALVAAAPFALAALAYDALGRGREAPAEAAGAVALSASTAAIALAGGLAPPAAFAASALLALRALTSVLYVRARIRLDRGIPAGPRAALAAHGAALLLAVVLAGAGLAPWLGALAFALLLGRAALGLSRRRRPIRPQRLGFQELAYGLLTLGLLAAGYVARV